MSERAAAAPSWLAGGQVIETPRLRITSLEPQTLAAMSRWLEEALGPEWTLQDLEGAIASGGGALVSDAGGAAIGVAALRCDAPMTGSAAITFLAINPERRFRGLGGEAGLALERHLRSLGFAKVYAPVPEGRGLAAYFWLRQGFRPLLMEESPAPLVGLDGRAMLGIWMLSG